jgi:hypothetical protein
MKRAVVLLVAIGFVVLLAAVFVNSGFAMENGITIFDTEHAALVRSPMAWEPALARDNGITTFARGPVSYDSGLAEPSEELVSAEGSAAGGLITSPGLHVENGITIFDTAPVDSN